jgi:hypothetical protein
VSLPQLCFLFCVCRGNVCTTAVQISNLVTRNSIQNPESREMETVMGMKESQSRGKRFPIGFDC